MNRDLRIALWMIAAFILTIVLAVNWPSMKRRVFQTDKCQSYTESRSQFCAAGSVRCPYNPFWQAVCS